MDTDSPPPPPLDPSPAATAAAGAAATPQPDGPRGTRQALLEAAIDLFGRDGFEATSTRAIAARAGVNISTLAYHFGGKQGLYLACAAHIADTMRGHLVRSAPGVLAGLGVPIEPDAARAGLRILIGRFARIFLETPEVERFVRFVVREQLDPTPAFDTLFHNLMEPMHRHVCALWGAATGQDPESPATKLATFGLVSQIVFTRVARGAVLRRLGWSAIGAHERDLVVAAVLDALEARLAHDPRSPR